jgi:hypothetical protein
MPLEDAVALPSIGAVPDYGHRVKQVRATVERFPYLELTRNKDFDVRATREQ